MSFENQKIHILIPHENEPGTFLVGPDGNYPADVYDPARHATLENVVHTFGRSLGAMTLAVAMREENNDGSIVYRTKPIPGIMPPESYSWRRGADDA